MSVADKITALRNHLNNAYTAISAKSGTVPTYKNSQNLQNAIATIPIYNPLTLAYISYADGLHAQPFVNLMASNNTVPVGSASHAFANTTTVTISGERNSTTALTTLDLSALDFSEVTDTICMFDNARQLATLTWANSVDFGEVENMEGMFRNTKALASVDLSKFTTSDYLESVFNIFSGSGVQSVTLGSNFDTSGVKYFYGMFNSCSSLTSITGLNTLDMTDATDLRAMFYNCSALTSLDLSGVQNKDHISLSTANANHMLAGMTALTSLNLSGWKSGSDDLATSDFWTANANLTTLTLNGAKRLSGGKLADSLVNTFQSKNGATIRNLIMDNVTFYTTDGTTAQLTDFSDVWAGSALRTIEMTGWDVSHVDPTSNSATGSITNTSDLTSAKIGDWTVPTNGVNLATFFGVDYNGQSGYAGHATNLTSLTITGNSVLKVYDSGVGEFKSSNAFKSCPIGNLTGHIYVSSAMVASYKADSFWGQYSSIISAIA